MSFAETDVPSIAPGSYASERLAESEVGHARLICYVPVPQGLPVCRAARRRHGGFPRARSVRTSRAADHTRVGGQPQCRHQRAPRSRWRTAVDVTRILARCDSPRARRRPYAPSVVPSASLHGLPRVGAAFMVRDAASCAMTLLIHPTTGLSRSLQSARHSCWRNNLKRHPAVGLDAGARARGGTRADTRREEAARLAPDQS